MSACFGIRPNSSKFGHYDFSNVHVPFPNDSRLLLSRCSDVKREMDILDGQRCPRRSGGLVRRMEDANQRRPIVISILVNKCGTGLLARHIK